MSAMQASMAAALVRELDGFERELALFPDEGSVWKTVPGVANPAGNLALHVAGNLQHFVGGVLGGSGYVRNRDEEFGRRSGARQEIVDELRKAASAVTRVVPALTPEMLAGIYPEPPVAGKQIQTGRFLLHLCVHASFHLGQAGYLRRLLTGDGRSSGALSLAALMEKER
jgi:hypothetical protein